MQELFVCFFCSELSFFASSELFLVFSFQNFLLFLWKKSFLNLTQNFFASSPSLHELFLHPYKQKMQRCETNVSSLKLYMEGCHKLFGF